MRAVIVVLLLATTAVPARGGVVAWVRDVAYPRLGAGIEYGVAVPMEPFDFGAGWRDGRGLGAHVSCALTPTVDVLLRAERDRFPLSGDGFRLVWPGIAELHGTDAEFASLALGLRVHQDRGAVRGHAAVYWGMARRTGRRVTVAWPAPAQPIPWGESDAGVQLLGFGVGATWEIPHAPDLTVEGRALWYPNGPEMTVPLRLGIALP